MTWSQLAKELAKCVSFSAPGWRMYYIERNGTIIVMLGGGDKSTQQADIAAAIALSKFIEE